MIPAEVLNALMLGRPLAAKLNAGDSKLHVWIYVSSTRLRDESWDSVRQHWTLTRQARGTYEPPRQFFVRYTRLTDDHLVAEERGDLDIAMRDMPADDWGVVTSDMSELEVVLSSFVSDWQTFRPPSTVGYPEPPLNFTTWVSVADLLNRSVESQ
jgi:DNA-binding transcriptional ArsR family regulator